MPEYTVQLNDTYFWEAVVEADNPEEAKRRAEASRYADRQPDWLISPWESFDSEVVIVSVEERVAVR